jgi:predicted DNA-binding transcriptional regulator YafY
VRKVKALERRQSIIEYLCEVRETTYENLMFEFQASKRTIQNDILELSLSYPIYTQAGRHGGGIFIAQDYYLGKQYLRPEEKELLETLSSSVGDDQRKILESIIRKFGKPNKNK